VFKSICKFGFLATLFLVPGCGPPEYCKMSGVVTYKGKPMAFLQVTLDPVSPDAARPPLSMTDKEGKYEMWTGSIEGVKRGEYRLNLDDPLREAGGKTSTEKDYLYVIGRYAAGKSEKMIHVDKHMVGYNIDVE
jgi:5-hydroxyisourate hydrolase-like protein (transthyretin family)